MLQLDIEEQIKAKLPGQVSEVLMERLKLADEAEKIQKSQVELEKEVAIQIENRQNLVQKLGQLERQLAEFKNRQKELSKKEIEIDKREAVLATKEELTAKHRNENLEIVKSVFANNRYKYTETGPQVVTDLYKDGYSSNQRVETHTKSIETES